VSLRERAYPRDENAKKVTTALLLSLSLSTHNYFENENRQSVFFLLLYSSSSTFLVDDGRRQFERFVRKFGTQRTAKGGTAFLVGKTPCICRSQGARYTSPYLPLLITLRYSGGRISHATWREPCGTGGSIDMAARDCNKYNRAAAHAKLSRLFNQRTAA
jgi:hypothetical protein